MPPKRRLAGYLRTSSQKQKEEMTIEDQRKFLTDQFTRLGMFDGTNPNYEFYPYDPENHSPENPSFFYDDGYNIEQEDPSTQFYDLCKRVERGYIDVVAVYAVNRIFRSEDEVFRAKIVKTFRIAGAKMLVGGSERNPAELSSIVEQHLSAEEKTRILRNCHQGKSRRAEKEGAPPSGHNKFGFRWHSHRFDRFWKEVPRDLETVRWMGCLAAGIRDPNLPAVFTQALMDRPLGFSDQEIVEMLAQNGYTIKDHLTECRMEHVLSKNPTGKIVLNFVQRILTDTTYAGSIQYHFMKPEEIRPGSSKGVTGEKTTLAWKVPAVFSPDEWGLIQERRQDRSMFARRNVVKSYLLKDAIHCAHCGKLMAARQGPSKKKGRSITTEKRSWYYVCARKTKASESGRCFNTSCINGRILEPLIWQKVCEYIKDPNRVAELISPDSHNETKELQILEDSLIAESNKLAPIQNKIDRINKLVVDGFLTVQAAIIQREHVRTEMDTTEKNISKYRASIRKKKAITKIAKIVDISKIQAQVGNRLTTLTFDERRSVITQVVDKLTINKEKTVEIRLRPFIAAPQN